MLQQTSVSGDLPLQPHLVVEQLAVTLALCSQTTPDLLQLILQSSDHMGEVLQLAGVQLLSVLQRVLQTFLLDTREQRG